MKRLKLIPKKSKRGITLVEAVVAVVILTMFATGVLTLLTTGRTKIAETNAAANAHAAATQKLDAVIAAISNGGYLVVGGTEGSEVVDVSSGLDNSLDIGQLFDDLDLDASKDSLSVAKLDCYEDMAAGTSTTTPDNVRGWYLKLTYNGATVTGFASNTQGVFD